MTAETAMPSVDCFNEYLEAYPEGRFSELAKSQLEVFAKKVFFPEIVSLAEIGSSTELTLASKSFKTSFSNYIEQHKEVEELLSAVLADELARSTKGSGIEKDKVKPSGVAGEVDSSSATSSKDSNEKVAARASTSAATSTNTSTNNDAAASISGVGGKLTEAPQKKEEANLATLEGQSNAIVDTAVEDAFASSSGNPELSISEANENKPFNWYLLVPLFLLIGLVVFFRGRKPRLIAEEETLEELKDKRTAAAHEGRKHSSNVGQASRVGRERSGAKEARAAESASPEQELSFAEKSKLDQQAKVEQALSMKRNLINQEISEEVAKSAFKIGNFRDSANKVFSYNNETELFSIIGKAAVEFSPTLHWEDSIIAYIYFSPQCITALDRFLANQKERPLVEEEGMIPEIGGILMGKPNLSRRDGKYRVMVEEFVAINPEFNDAFKLEFSTESLVKDLGDIQDEFPEYTVIGWFHTHPGHGLFLSKPDLTIQKQFFSEPYQFAMEIDSLTEKLDTAFFTRTKDGVINNTDAKIKESNWFSWLDEVASINTSNLS